LCLDLHWRTLEVSENTWTVSDTIIVRHTKIGAVRTLEVEII